MAVKLLVDNAETVARINVDTTDLDKAWDAAGVPLNQVNRKPGAPLTTLPNPGLATRDSVWRTAFLQRCIDQLNTALQLERDAGFVAAKKALDEKAKLAVTDTIP